MEKEYINRLLNFWSNQKDNTLNISCMLDLNTETNATLTISYINTLLKSPGSNASGLRFLNDVILHCPPSVIQENAMPWINMCIYRNNKQSLNSVHLQILAKIISSCSKIPDFHKSFINILPKIMDICLASSPAANTSDDALNCLQMCLIHYPSACSPFKDKIELHLKEFLSKQLPKPLITKAGCCFHYLQQTGNAGVDGITHKNNWNLQVSKCCSTIHKLYEAFFDNVTEYNDYNDEGSGAFEFVEGHPFLDVLFMCASRLKNLIVFLNIMLVKKYPVEKVVPLYKILNVIKRGLEVDIYENKEDFQLQPLLHEHQMDLLYLLRSLIVCCRLQALKFSFTISKLLTDCLYRTNKTYFKTNSEYKITTYKVINIWITTVMNKLGSAAQKKLVQCILSDITPARNDKITQLCGRIAQNTSAKAKKRAIEERIIDMNHLQTDNIPNKTKENAALICAGALNTAYILFGHVHSQLESATFEIFYRVVIKQLLTMQAGKPLLFYSDSKCKLGLYKVLAALLKQSYFCNGPMIQVTMNIFSSALNSCRDTNEEMYLICTQAMDDLERLAQPTGASLGFAERVSNSESNGNLDGIMQSHTKNVLVSDEVLEGLSFDSTISPADDDSSSFTTSLPQNETLLNNSISDLIPPSKRIKILSMSIVPQITDRSSEESLRRIQEQEAAPCNPLPENADGNGGAEEDESKMKTEDKEIKMNTSITVASDVAPASNGIALLNSATIEIDDDDDEVLLLNSFKDEVNYP